MGLLDIFGGGGSPVASDDPYAGLLSEAQQRAARSEGLGAIAGALARAAQGIDGRRVGFGQGIGLAAEAYDKGQDQGALKFLQIQKLAAETTNLKELAALRKSLAADDQGMLDAIIKAGAAPTAGTPTPPGGSTSAPGGGGGGAGGLPKLREGNPGSLAMAASPEEQERVAQKIATTDGLQHWAPFNAPLKAAFQQAGLPLSGPISPEQWAIANPLIKKYESAGGQNIPNYRFDATHTAGGPHQVTNSTWRAFGGAVPGEGGGGGAPEGSAAPTAVLPPEFNMRPAGGYAGLLGGGSGGGGPGTAPVLPSESPMEYARRTGLQPGLGGGSGGGAPPIIPPGAGGDYGGGDGGGYLPPAGFGGMVPGQGPLASSVANLPPMPPPQAASPVMQGPLAAPPPIAPAAPAGPGPLAAPSAPRAGPSYMPQMPGGDNQQLLAAQALIARQRMRAALAGITGDPYGGYADLLKNSPAALRQAELIKQQAEYYGPGANPALKGAITTAEEQARTPELFKRETQKTDEQIRLEGAKAGFTEQLDAWKQGRAAQLDFETVLVKNPETGRLEERKVPKSVLAQQFNPNAGAANITPGSDTGTAPPAGTKPSDGVPPGGLNIVGKPVYTPDEEAKLKQVPTDYAKYLVENRLPVAQGAAQTLAFNGMARDLLDKGVFTGAGGTLKLQLAKAKQLLPGDWSDERIANTETFISTQARQVASILASKAFGSGSSITDNDRQYAAGIAGGDIKLDEQSLRRLVNINERAAKWEFDRYNDSVKTFDPEKRFDFLRVPDPVPLQLPQLGPRASAEPARASASPGYNAVGPKGHKIYSVDGQKWYDATTNQPVN